MYITERHANIVYVFVSGTFVECVHEDAICAIAVILSLSFIRCKTKIEW